MKRFALLAALVLLACAFAFGADDCGSCPMKKESGDCGKSAACPMHKAAACSKDPSKCAQCTMDPTLCSICNGCPMMQEKSNIDGAKDRVSAAAEKISDVAMAQAILEAQSKGDPQKMQELTAESRKAAELRRKEREKREKEEAMREEQARKEYEKTVMEYEKKYDRKYPGTYADYKRHEYYGHPDYARVRHSDDGWMEVGGSTSSSHYSASTGSGGSFGPSASVREGGYSNTSVGVRSTVIELDR
ncbi:MAG: hypothetical protein L6R28_14080 [Planctomycetes bacterium]|nr:hypothetical protein [Planctomycetota bacterium]